MYIFSDSVNSVYHKTIKDFELLGDYVKTLEFEKTLEDGTIDLRDNCKVTYKNSGLTLMQCPLFETEHSFLFYKRMVSECCPGFQGKLVFDCGACCGLDAILFAKEGCRVICLEPDSKNFENLRLNTSGMNITILNKALFCHNDTVLFSSENTQGSMILGKEIDIPVEDLKKIRKCDSIKVQCTTLNEMCDLFGVPDIVKIDIEGAEYDLIKNASMSKVLTHGSFLILEIHQRENCPKQFETLTNYIKSFGYEVKEYSDPLVGYHIACSKTPHQKSDASLV